MRRQFDLFGLTYADGNSLRVDALRDLDVIVEKMDQIEPAAPRVNNRIWARMRKRPT